MSATTSHPILIVEPTPELAEVYDFFPQDNRPIHVTSTQRATRYLQNQTPSLVAVSASYSPPQIFRLLETIKEKSSASLFLIPVVFVIDLKHKTNFIPGTFWGQKLGVINSLSSQQEVKLVMARVNRKQKSLGFN